MPDKDWNKNSTPEAVRKAAQRGLDLRKKFGRGGTAVGIARARDLAAGKNIPMTTIARMYSFFSRHEVDKQGADFNNKEKPSNGAIAWKLWGGDSGYAWASRIWKAYQKEKAGD